MKQVAGTDKKRMETIEALKILQNEIKWNEIPFNDKIILDENILEEFRHKFNWSLLSQSANIKWTEELIERYFLLWDFKSLSKNLSIPWTLKLLNKFSKYWDLESLKNNHVVCELINKFSPLGADLILSAIVIIGNAEMNNNRYRGNSKNAGSRSWKTYNDSNYCDACMMSPCHCSDPDPG